MSNNQSYSSSFNGQSSWPDASGDFAGGSDRGREQPQTLPFLLEPKNQDIVMGRRPYSVRSNIGGLIFGLLFSTLLSMVFLFLLGRDLYENYQLQNSGVEVPARVTNHYTTDCGDDGTCYHLVATYSVPRSGAAPQTLTRNESVSESDYSQYSQAVIRVRYLPGDPKLARLVVKGNFNGMWNMTWEVGLILLIVVIELGVLYLLGRGYRRVQRLARYGQLVPGELLKINGNLDEGSYAVTADYGFVSPTGQYLTGKGSHVRNDLKKQGLPARGTPLAIFYADDATHRVL